jgi:uncharacterized RDD family membrane protein YckC
MAASGGSASPLPRAEQAPSLRPAADRRRIRARGLQGRRAGFVSRVSADAIDVVVIVAIEFGLIALASVVRFLITRTLKLPSLPTWASLGSFVIIALAYLTSGWAATGKTLGKQLAGIRVLRTDGGPLGTGRSFVRAALYVIFPAGLVWSLLSRRDASVQDLLLRTVVVYEWASTPLEA